MTAQQARAQLHALADADYRRFNQGLLPGVQGVLGVRTPHLRRMAREIARGDWQGYLTDAGGQAETYEEKQLLGMVIGYAKAPFEAMLPHIDAHVKRLDSWATVDTFCCSLKLTRGNREAMWAYLLPYFAQEDAYPLRFAIVMALWYYLDDAYLDEVLALLDGVRHEAYYVRMAVAWAISMAYVKDPARGEAYLAACTLDDWTYNKALQKIIESRQVDEATRGKMRAMKRKGDAHAKDR